MRLLALTLMALVLTLGAYAEETSAPDEFRQIITSQLGALQNGDAEGAWAFAHPSIKRQFGTPDRFYQMVDRGYRPLIDFTLVRFREAEQADDVWIQPVWLQNDNDEQYIAYYAMARNDEGEWRIAGCQIYDYEPPGI